MTTQSFDLVVLGAGPGGYVAAIRAAQLGLKTAVVEREHLGGICLNWGCIPTKALLRCAEVASLAKNGAQFGVKIEGLSFDIERMVKYSRDVSSRLSTGVGHLLKKNKVEVIMGSGKLAGNGQLLVTDAKGASTSISAKHIILATGARARVLPGLEPDGELVWTYKEAMVPKRVPKSLIVVGSGAIGIEFASFYNAIGVDVTVVEVMDRILPVEDADVSKEAEKQFKKHGLKIMTKAMVKKLDRGQGQVTAHIEQNGKMQQLTADVLISAVGITANTEGLGLEATKVKLDRGHVVTDGYGRTDEPGVYAIGDIAGAPWLAHKASHEGIICVEKIAGLNPHTMDKTGIPGCTYAHPQVASVGMTEAAAKEAGYKVKVGRFPFLANGKAIALGEDQGFIKTVFDEKTGELLGAHMIGAEVTELIQGYTIAKSLETTELDLMHTVFPHPTLSEMMHEAVLDAYGRAVHF